MDLQRWTKKVWFTNETVDSGGKLTLPAQVLFFSRISRRAVHHCIKEENRSNYKIISPPWIRVTRGQVMLEKDCYIGKWKGGPDRNLNQNARNPTKLQASKAFCTSYYPQVSFILEGLQRGLNARSRSIKHARVTVFPEDPCPKYDQRIETFLSMFLYFLPRLPPPSCKGDRSPGWYQTYVAPIPTRVSDTIRIGHVDTPYSPKCRYGDTEI